MNKEQQDVIEAAKELRDEFEGPPIEDTEDPRWKLFKAVDVLRIAPPAKVVEVVMGARGKLIPVDAHNGALLGSVEPGTSLLIEVL